MTTLAIDPQQPQVLYAGTRGGVFKSVDGGTTWSPRSDGIRDQRGFLPADGVLALAVDPSDTEVVYAGARQGTWKTTDGGASWLRLVGDAGDYIIAIDPAATATIYAASPFGGIRKSVDGGDTWRGLAFTFGGPLRAIAVHPYRPQTVLVGTTYAGVLVSHDGGGTWQGPSPNFPEGVHSFAFDSREPDRVYAGAERGGVYRSADAGVTWRQWYEGLPSEPFAVTSALAGAPDEPGTFYATAGPGLYVRSDGDASWTPIAANALDVEIGALVAGPQGTVYAATVGGTFRNDPADRAWRLIATGMRSSTVLTLAMDPANPEVVLAGTDGGGVQRSTDFGRTWAPLASADPGAELTNAVVGGLAIDPTDPARIVASACGVLISDDGGRSWVRTLGTPGDECRRVAYDAGIEPTRFAFDPSDPARVFAALGDLHRSIDGGSTWIRVGVELGDGVQCHGLAAVTVDPVDSQVVYAVETIGGPVKSTDGGASFPPVGCHLLPYRGPAAVAIDPTTSKNVYAGFSRGLVKSIDRGETWKMIRGIDSVSALAFDPADATTLYAGTESGVFVSRDGAGSWAPLNDGLLAARVYALAIDPRDGRTLLAGTDGGAVQRLRLDDR